MELLLALPYIISGSICLVLGVILFFVRPHEKELSQNSPYQTIKKLLAYSAFLDVIVDIITVLGISFHLDFYLLDYFFIPIIYFIQLIMMSYAIMGITHSTVISRHFWITNIFIVLTLFVIYMISYIVYAIHNHEGGITESYISFIDTIFATIFHISIYLYIAGIAVSNVIHLFLETKKYDKGLINIHSGRNVTEGRKFEIIAYLFMFYFLLAIVDFLWHDDTVNTIIILINTCFFVIFIITILDLQDVYYNVMSVTIFDDSFHFEATKDPSEIPSIQEKINQWISAPEKEWLTEGITLTTVADKMRIKPRLLSGYLNDILGLNFNRWICKLRIEEAKKMIKDNPSLPICEIAYETGFSDTSSLSRTFKQITGKSPSEFKRSLKS